MYLNYIQAKMQILRPELHNFDDFLDWVGTLFNKADRYNEKGSGSVALSIESLDVSVTKVKKESVLRGRRGGAKYNSDLRGCQGVQQSRFKTGLELFKYAFIIAAHQTFVR